MTPDPKCQHCKGQRWEIADTGVLVCTTCDMGPLGIPRGNELRMPQ